MTTYASYTAARDVIEGYLAANWNRSGLLSTLSGAPTLPDPGHGEDEISPIVFQDEPWDPADSSATGMSPFTPEDLQGTEGGDAGCGWVQVRMQSRGRLLDAPRGGLADVRMLLLLECAIATPPYAGFDLGELYSCGLRVLLWEVALMPGGVAANSSLVNVRHTGDDDLQVVRAPELQSSWIYTYYYHTLVVTESNPGPAGTHTITTT